MNKGFGLLVISILMLSSCLKDNEVNTVYYEDTALSSFSLGTLKCTVHTKSSTGEDSTYTANVVGSSFAFSIDQQRGLVYNLDSLPQNTDVSRAICTATVKNAGSILINLHTKDGQRDSLVLYSSTDSIDFSKPVEFRVYNQSGSSFRKYMVEVRVHQQNGDDFHWSQASLTDDEMASLLALRTQPSNVGEVVGEDALDTDADWLPTTDLNLVKLPLKTSDDAYRMILVGNRSAESHAADTTAMVWGKIVDSDDENASWFFYTPTTENRNQLPRMRDLQVTAYGNLLLAIGGQGLGACTQAPYTAIYVSEDCGLTWHQKENISLPEGIDVNSRHALVADAEQNLWLINETTKQAWRGYLNRMKWNR